MTMQQQQAWATYTSGSATQKQIAAQAGVSEKTVYNWTRQFGWHAQRQQQHEYYSTISTNLCTQIIACQQAITDRGDLPTPKEFNMHARLINSVLKLDKAVGKTAPADTLTAFLEYVAGYNEELGGQLLDLYLAYAQSVEKKKTARKQPVKTGNQSKTTSNDAVTIPATAVPEKAPITEQDFKEYKHLLNTNQPVTDNHTTRFRGRFVNTRWLQYNLLQYCLPPTERRFIGDARKIRTDTDPNLIQQQIAQYGNTLKPAA